MKLFCKHDYQFYRNIYGDEINHFLLIHKIYRSIDRCTKCGKLKYKEELHKD